LAEQSDFLAGVVTFDPKIVRLRESVDSILKQVDRVFVFDNASNNIEEIEQLLKEYGEKAVLYKNNTNVGMAGALAGIMEYASDNGYEWVLSMDQDSVLQPRVFSAYRQVIQKRSDAGMLTCLIKDRNFSDDNNELQRKKIKEVPYCITSGSLISVKAYSETSGYDKSFFIDGVDFDICYSLREKGYKIYRVNYFGLLHEVGHGENRCLFGKNIVVYNESSNRVYYMARNKIKLFRKHKEYGVYTLVTKEVGLLFRICFYEKDKWQKVKMFWKGVADALMAERE